MTSLVLLGAGGHARAVVEILEDASFEIAAYADMASVAWLTCRRMDENDIAPDAAVAFGLGGVTPDQLSRRLKIARDGWSLIPVVHARATVSRSAVIGAGAHVLANAVVQPAARIGRLAIVNSSAIVEHDADIGEGAHVAPGAIVLGGAKVGRAAMIGAGAVILPGAHVADGMLVKSGTVHGNKAPE